MTHPAEDPAADRDPREEEVGRGEGRPARGEGEVPAEDARAGDLASRVGESAPGEGAAPEPVPEPEETVRAGAVREEEPPAPAETRAGASREADAPRDGEEPAPEGSAEPGPEEPGPSPAEQAALAFHEYLRREARGGFDKEERERFRDALPEEVRDLFDRMVRDLELVRGRRAHGAPRRGLRLGHYRLIEPIGQGGAGSVWRAEDGRLDREVAVKILHPQLALSELQVERFERESRLAAAVDHPNLLRVHDVGFDQGLHYLVTELVPGGRTLLDRIQEARSAPHDPAYPRRVAETFVQVCRAMEAVHAAGITHRDLKPNNILLRPDGTPLVADFGLAAVVDEESLGVTTLRMGTTFYLAPEQVGAAGVLGPRSDVFSLGVSLYEALVLARPFDGDTAALVGQRILEEEPPAPRRVRPGLPRDLETICLRAMEKAPARRYAHAGELADDLQRFLDHQPILARPDGPVRRLFKLVRRNPVRSSVAVAGFVLLGVGVAYTLETARLSRGIRERNQSLERSLGALREMAVYMAIGNLQRRGELDPEFLGTLEAEARTGLAGEPVRLGETLATVASFSDEMGLPGHALDLFGEATGLLEASPAPAGVADEVRLQWADVLQRELRPQEALEVLLPVLERVDPEREPLRHARTLTRAQAAAGLLKDEEVRARLDREHGELGVVVGRGRGAAEGVGGSASPEDTEGLLDLERWQLEARLRRGEVGAAFEDADRVFRLHRRLVGTNHPRAIEVGLLAIRSWKEGGMRGLDPRFFYRARAVALSGELLRLARERLGARTAVALQALRVRAETFVLLGRYPEALPLYEDLVEGYRRRLGPGSPRLLEVEVGYALMLAQCGEHHRALELLEENLARRERIGFEGRDEDRTARRAWIEVLAVVDTARLPAAAGEFLDDLLADGSPEARVQAMHLMDFLADTLVGGLPPAPSALPGVGGEAEVERRLVEVLSRAQDRLLEGVPGPDEGSMLAFRRHAILAATHRRWGDADLAREWWDRALAGLEAVAPEQPRQGSGELLRFLASSGDPDGRGLELLRRLGEPDGLPELLEAETSRVLLLASGLEQVLIAWAVLGQEAALELLEDLAWFGLIEFDLKGCCRARGNTRSCARCPDLAVLAHLVRGLPEERVDPGLWALLERLCEAHVGPCDWDRPERVELREALIAGPPGGGPR